jgi:hypothetical protein
VRRDPASHDAVSHAPAQAARPPRLPLLIGAGAAAVVLVVVGVVALAFLGSSEGAGAETANAAAPAVNASNTARGLTSGPAPAAGRDASERTIEITVTDGKAEVYRGDVRVGTTPYAVRGRLGDRVRLTLRRDGYSDEPVDFVVGEKKAFMYTLAKK